MKLTKNFELEEFDCHDGKKVPDHLIPNVVELCRNLEIIRESAGNKSIKILSGYRTVEYNKRVGGKPTSQHLFAKAADIKIDGMTPGEVNELILKLMAQGKIKNGGLGSYPGFTHYDIGNARHWG
jgi:uncharacterized protein YcbK (DUF882 family)